MTTFFSGTDMSELHDNAGSHNYYLSLIVNFSGLYSARVAFVAKRNIIMEYTNVNDESKTFNSQKELLMMIDMNIIKEAEEVAVPDFFRTRYESVKANLAERAAAEAAKREATYSTHCAGFAGHPGWEDWETDDTAGSGDVTKTTAKAESGQQSGGAKSYAITPKGTLVKSGKELRTRPKVELDIASVILEWLNSSTTIFSDLAPDGNFTNIPDALAHFKEYFEDTVHDKVQFDWFSDQMQRDMYPRFKRWFPKLIQRVGMEQMDLLEGNPVAGELYELFEAYPHYVNQMFYNHNKANVAK